jgi:hypothetical protein
LSIPVTEDCDVTIIDVNLILDVPTEALAEIEVAVTATPIICDTVSEYWSPLADADGFDTVDWLVRIGTAGAELDAIESVMSSTYDCADIADGANPVGLCTFGGMTNI